MVQSLALENPLLEGLPEERRPEPFAMVIFGAHGDLTKRMLIPSIYALYMQNLLPENFAVLGTSRTELTDEQFRSGMREAVVKFSDVGFEEDAWAKFSNSLFYIAGNAQSTDSYEELKSFLEKLAREHGTLGNNIFYLSTPPSLYSPIIKGLAEVGLAHSVRPNEPAWPRVVVEKPFGHDLSSALQLDQEIHDVLTERQVYRIDHYLGKETVQNIMCFRFANSIFEPIWTREYVDHIQITNAESIGIEGRGSYYEEAGAMRDMIQNHLMQLVALVAMEPPISLDSEATRDERMKVLKALRPFDSNTIDQFAVRGQYAGGFVLGNRVGPYRDENRVSKTSNVETYAALKLYVDNWRWADVPIYVRTGKCMPKRITEIAIHFRRPPHSLFKELGGIGFRGNLDSPNILVMRIQPDQGISLKFATKQPGPTTQIRWLTMDFKYGTAFGDRTPSAYERLIHDCMLGDPSLFARSDFVEASWRLLQPVIDYWQSTAPERSKGASAQAFPNYDSGTWGPRAADELIASTGHHWREP
ncbi:MAG: glucose-6-phosphate dehydrogenase [Cyanobacteria bacterium]|nr:glucose-6-phosphate dehydrogenase [Cyanobacteriota bacterium]